MASKKIKLTEGWLARDAESEHGVVVFFDPVPICEGGVWYEGRLACWLAGKFDRIYGLEQAPGYGEKMLVDMEL